MRPPVYSRGAKWDLCFREGGSTFACMTTTTAATRSIAVLGVSHRALRICHEVPAGIAEHWRVWALWDVDARRFDAFRQDFPDIEVRTYLGPARLGELFENERPDAALICARDGDHAALIIASLDAGVDVIVEKPMVIDCAQARAVLDAEARSSASVRVMHNYRYMPMHQAIQRELASGLIGRVTAVEMSLYVDERHGSSYFQRWNRYRAVSGGLTISKECHYLDLLNWWLGQKPIELFGYSALNYYGPDSEHNPSQVNGRHCATCDEIDRCAYQQIRGGVKTEDTHILGLQSRRLSGGQAFVGLYTGYQPDACIFDADIDIEDTYASVIRYDGGTMVSFSVNFSSPFEQYRVVFNGTRGRLECGYAFGQEGSYDGKGRALVHYPLFTNEPHVIEVAGRAGGHHGGDPAMLEDICSELDHHTSRASACDGALAVALGEAMWRSPKEERAIGMEELLGGWY